MPIQQEWHLLQQSKAILHSVQRGLIKRQRGLTAHELIHLVEMEVANYGS